MDSAERAEQHSTGLKKELGLRDLVLAKILYFVGSGWVGTAAKLGNSHIVFWLAAVMSTLGVMLSTNLSYAFAAPWMSGSKGSIVLVMCVQHYCYMSGPPDNAR
jgi:hypothetical protein